jgi:hypothetical protein
MWRRFSDQEQSLLLTKHESLIKAGSVPSGCHFRTSFRAELGKGLWEDRIDVASPAHFDATLS